MSESLFYEPGKGERPLPHDPIKAIIAPRPIGWISTIDAAGVPNLAPYSFFNGFCSNPWIIGFSNERPSDSLANCAATGEFVHNLVPLPLAEVMNQSSAPYPADVDEAAELGLAMLPCVNVRPLRVAASPASLECKVLEIKPMVGLNGEPGSATLVLGQVVGVHIDTAYLDHGVFQTTRAAPVARAGGTGDYSVMNRAFTIGRPDMSSILHQLKA